ncbi:MAG TPA: FAD-dependent oxidoreductase [Streptosporangiales bacterium]
MIDVRNPGDGFAALRAHVHSLGTPPGDDRGAEGTPLTVGEWALLIDDIVAHPERYPEGLWNVATPDEDDREYDAIFVGGGASGRFGSAYLRARGGRQLTIDAWPFLGGSCPHQACVPHHLFSECAHELDLAKHMQGRLWYPPFDPDRARIVEIIELFKAGRGLPHAIMNWQSKEQLDMEYILNARATVVDEHTVEVEGRRFRAKNLVLCTGARTEFPDIPGIDREGVFDFASLVERLDYEPSSCVIIGGSKVALEYGSFFQATGCPTTILTRSPLMRTASLHHVDDGLRDYVIAMMADRGIEIVEGAEPLEVLGDRRVTGVRYRTPDGRVVDVDTDFVFVGTGEKPDLSMYESLGLKTDDRGFVVADASMRTSVPSVYAVGDLLGPPMEMFKARKCGVAAARNIMGDDYEFDFSEYPDFLHTTYEVTWCGLSEAEARARYGEDEIIKIQMPPDDADPESFALPAAEGSMLYAFTRPILSGWLKLLIDRSSRRVVGAHHVGYGAKDAFQYIDHLIRRPEGFTIDDMAELNELFLNPEHFIQLSRLRAGQLDLVNL